MKSYFRLFSILIISAIISGCGSAGAFNTANITQVELSDANYEIVATNVTGEASSGYLIGISANYQRQLQTFAMARFSGSGMIYGEALQDLWSNFREQYGEVNGRNLALINVRYDTDALNLILFTTAKVAVRADVIESNNC